MTNKKLEKTTYDCQIGMYFSKIISLQNGFIIYSDTVLSPEWNFLFGFHAKNVEEFEKVLCEAKTVFKKIGRAPAFTISPLCKISQKVKAHILKTYSQRGDVATMVTKKICSHHTSPKGYSFKKIDNQKEKEIFVQTFSTSKSQTLPDDVYSPLPEYFSDALKKSFDNKTDWNFEHYLSLYRSKPVGMVSCCVKSNLCGLYGGGTYVKHRSKGVFSNLLKFVSDDMKQRGVKFYFLIAEKDTKNETFYNHLGFKEKFSSKLFEF